MTVYSQRISFWLFLLAFLGVASEMFAVSFPLRWRWSNPSPHGGNINCMAYGDGLTVQVCERGQIYTSDDLVTWVPRESGTTNSLRGVTFFGDGLVMVGENGTVVHGDALDDFHYINLDTPDWLESVAASETMLVAVGDNGAIYTSTNAITWTRETVPFTTWLRSVAYGNNLFVAVGEDGFIVTRGNNGVWTPRSSGKTQHLNKVMFTGSQFRIAGDGGVALAGSGQSWASIQSLPSTNTLFAPAVGDGSVLFVGDKEVLYKENTGAWLNQISGSLINSAPSWTYYDALWQDSLYFIAGRSGMMVEGFKTNSSTMTWVTRFDSIRNWIWDLFAVTNVTTNLYVAVGDRGTIMTSEDGINWELELVPDAITNRILLGVGGSTNGFVAVGNRGAITYSPGKVVEVIGTNSAGQTVTNKANTLGIEWRAVSPLTTNDLQGVTMFGNLYVVCGGGGTILTSPNGTNWTQRSTPTDVFLSSVAAMPSGLVACGDHGVVLTSSDAINWTLQNSFTTNWIYRLRYANGGLIGVGENGLIATTPNGTNWAIRASGTTKWLNSVTYNDGHYFVVGNQGTVLTSSNKTVWTSIGTITQKSLYGVASTAEQLVVAGVEGAILRAAFNPSLDPFLILNYSRVGNVNTILVAGKTDQRFRIQHSTNLVTWSDGVTLEIVDRSGTFLFLENADTNYLRRDFMRAQILP